MSEADQSLDFGQIFRQLANETSIDPEVLLNAMKKEDGSMPTLQLLDTTIQELWAWFSSASRRKESTIFGMREIAKHWKTHAFHQAKSALLLDKSGLADSSVANSRSSMEYGAYLSLLALSQDPRTDVVDKLAKKSLNRSKFSLDAISQDDSSELSLLSQMFSQLLEDDTPDPMRVHNFKSVCDRFENGETIYFYFHFLSSLIHPGINGTLMLLPDKVFLASGINLKLTYQRISLKMAVGGCAWASWAANSLIDPDDFEERFGTIVREMGFVPLTLKNSTA